MLYPAYLKLRILGGGGKEKVLEKKSKIVI